MPCMGFSLGLDVGMCADGMKNAYREDLFYYG